MRLTEPVDLLIIGGGINGAAIARDAAGRGLSVLLCEQDDLASGTSSMSSKLIHGGLRYLEQFQFRLVREALSEREVILRAAPHIVRPLRFVLPHNRLQRPVWQIRIGLFLYDHMGGRRKRLAASRRIDLTRDPAGPPLQSEFTVGFSYADCWTDDSRLVVANARDAADRGAEIRTRTRCVAARRSDGLWQVTLQPRNGGESYEAGARILVNAAGPWIREVMESALGQKGYGHLRLVKGSHLLFPRLYEEDHAYILQNTDGRVVFTIPFPGRFTLVGTTDQPYTGDPGAARIDPEEAQYLCAAVNRYFRRPISPEEAVWSYSGVRPLFEDQVDNPSAVSRDYVLELEAPAGQAPLLAVIGGKLTAHREVAEHTLKKLEPFLPRPTAPWTRRATLPGGEIPRGDVAAYAGAFRRAHPWLPEGLATSLVSRHGSLAGRVLGSAASQEDLGVSFGEGLYEREVEYLRAREWAMTAEDILWRRTKLGLAFSPRETEGLRRWLAASPRAGGQ